MDPAALEVTAKAISAWIPPGCDLSIIPGTPIIELSLPEYDAAGLGRVLCRSRGFSASGANGVAGTLARSMCADTSRLFVVTAEMQPTVIGQAHDEIQALAPRATVRHLFDVGFPIELVSLGACRAAQFPDLDQLTAFVRLYHERASWLEAHPLDVAIAKLESQLGAALVFDGARLFCEGA